MLRGQVDAQAPADRAAGVVLVAGEAGRIDIKRRRVLEHGFSIVFGESVVLRAASLGELLDGGQFELVWRVFRIHGREARQAEAVQVLAVGVEGQLLGDHGRGEALQGAPVRGQQVRVEAASPVGAGGVLADEDPLAVRDPLPGQDDLTGQDPGLVDHLGPGLPLFGHSLPKEDDAQEWHDNADDGRDEFELQRALETEHGVSSRPADEPRCLVSSMSAPKVRPCSRWDFRARTAAGLPGIVGFLRAGIERSLPCSLAAL